MLSDLGADVIKIEQPVGEITAMGRPQNRLGVGGELGDRLVHDLSP